MKCVAEFKINHFHLINHLGEPCGELPKIAESTESMIELYRRMVESRAFDKKAVAMQRTGKIGTYAPIHGQEAISAAISFAITPTDVFIPYYRDYAVQFSRGVSMKDILAYWGGDERANSRTLTEDLPIAVPIASQCLHAAGVAYAFKYRQEARVAVVTLGDGATSEGDFYEAINVAGVWSLPVVFIVNNNQWAISVPLSQQTACQTIAQKAIAAGFEGIQVDGNDCLGSFQVIQSSIEKARTGHGPTLIEALSYRLCDHTTADDAKRYQPAAEVEDALLKEPINRFRLFLERYHGWSQTEETQLIHQTTAWVEEAAAEYLAEPKANLTDIFDHHFAHLPDYLIEERATALEEFING